MFTLTTISHFISINATHCVYNQLNSKHGNVVKHEQDLSTFDFSSPRKINASTFIFQNNMINFETCLFSQSAFQGSLPSFYTYNETGIYFENGSIIPAKINPYFFYPMKYALVNPTAKRYFDLNTGKFKKLNSQVDSTGFIRSLYFDQDIYANFKGENITLVNGELIYMNEFSEEQKCSTATQSQCPTTDSQKTIKAQVIQLEKTIKEQSKLLIDTVPLKKLTVLETEKANLNKKYEELEKNCSELSNSVDNHECPKSFNVEKAKRLQKYQIALTGVGFVGVTLFVLIA